MCSFGNIFVTIISQQTITVNDSKQQTKRRVIIMTKRVADNVHLETKMGRIDQACKRYGLGRCTMQKFAREAGAVVKVGNR